MGPQHRQHHRQPARVPADHGAARGTERGRRHQRLQFHQRRAGALDAGEPRCPDCRDRARTRNNSEGFETSRKPFPVISTRRSRRWAKTILHGARMRNCWSLRPGTTARRPPCARRRGAPRSGRPRSRGDQDDRRARFLRKPDERLRGGAHLRHRARANSPYRSTWSDRIDHDQPRHRTADSVETISSTEVSAASCTGASARPDARRAAAPGRPFLAGM